MFDRRRHHRVGPRPSGLSESDWALLESVDLCLEALQIGVVDVEDRARRGVEVGGLSEDQDHACESECVLEALAELKAAAREMRAWAASIASRGS